ncbi:hypothetical protein [Caldanaerovirga acetigignens]|uniref:hypothetical protein n=1 Tax=Caldanaerovirga acetigignens TaxID=447595 RepID=UPI0018E08F61|nr:hypothetical protein [Caldanaerovirga acetigignens]
MASWPTGRNIILQHLLRAGAYTVRVVRKNRRFDCFISFSHAVSGVLKWSTFPMKNGNG